MATLYEGVKFIAARKMKKTLRTRIFFG